jgi:chaperonin cofactor prefoldin
LIKRSITNRGFIASAEDILLKIKFVTECGIVAGYEENFDIFQSNLENASNKLEELQDKYKISRDVLNAMVKGKRLQDVDELLKNKIEECSEKERILLEEWKIYSRTLKSMGHEVPALPQGLRELENGVKKLKKECMSTLGGEGLCILSFLKGEGDFPDKISIDDIKKVLEILRPIFAKFLKEES